MNYEIEATINGMYFEGAEASDAGEEDKAFAYLHRLGGFADALEFVGDAEDLNRCLHLKDKLLDKIASKGLSSNGETPKIVKVK